MALPKFQLISEKLVKPSLITPLSLRDYKLSLLDQLIPNWYIPMAFFYPNNQHKHPNNSSHISSLLEASLSKTLSSYYPFAGRLTDNISVDCNDMGATLLEARVECPMSDILNSVDGRVHDIVYPNGLPWNYAHDQPSLVVAQLSHFDCGGIALSVCLRHNIADAHTLCNFIHDWAAIARHSNEKPSPEFIGSSILPPIDDYSTQLRDMERGKNCITKRYTFDSEKLSELKAKAVDESGVENPTRVEVVSALIYKCAMSASMLHSGAFKPSVLLSMLNLRPLIGPPATQSYAGNLLSTIPVFTTNESEINFSRLVSEIRKGKVEGFEKYKRITATGLHSATLEGIKQINILHGTTDMDVYGCTSMCKFLTENIDFGWGSPIRVSLAATPLKNSSVLINNQNGDGIDALVTLDEQAMSMFQSDPDILAFASISNF